MNLHYIHLYLCFSWIANHLEVALIGEQVDLTYGYEVSFVIKCLFFTCSYFLLLSKMRSTTIWERIAYIYTLLYTLIIIILFI